MINENLKQFDVSLRNNEDEIDFRWPSSEENGYLDEPSSKDSFVPNSKIDYISEARKGWYPTQMIPFKKFNPLKNKRINEDDLWAHVLDPLVDLQEPWRSNYHSFLVDLYAYSQCVPKENRAITITCIHDRSIDEGPAFAKWLDGFKTYCCAKYNNRKFFSSEVYDTYRGIPVPSKFTIGDIYRSNFVFFWKPERDSIESYSFKPIVTDDEVVHAFGCKLEEFLEDDRIEFLTEIDHREFLKSNSQGTFSGRNLGTKYNGPATVRGRSRIAYVDRELKAARTACVEELDSVIRIRMIEQNVSQIISLDKRNAMKNAPHIVKKRLEKALQIWNRKSERFSYCRDFEKEGLTKPRYLLRIMLEKLFKRTNWSCFENAGFFDVWCVEDDQGDLMYPTRGHGLGMANSLTTLMSIIIEEICRDNVDAVPIDTLYCNDDAALIFRDKKAAEEYAAQDRSVCEKLGLSFKDKASFVVRGEVVFCEQYARVGQPYYSLKLSHNYMGFYNILKCANAAHARTLTCSVNATRIPQHCIDQVMSYWGWVLFRNEFTRPANHGGWFRSTYDYVDLSYTTHHAETIVPREDICSRLAYKNVKLEFFPWDRTRVRERLYDFFDPSYLKERSIDEYCISKDYRKTKYDPHEFKRAYDKYQEILRKEFARQQRLFDKGDISLTYLDIWAEDEAAAPERDFIAPKGAREELTRDEIVCHWSTSFRMPYGTYGLLNSAYVYGVSGGENAYNLKVGNREIYLGSAKFHDESSWDAGKKRAKSMYPGLTLTDWEAFLFPKDEDLKVLNDPFTVLAVCDKMGSDYKIYRQKVITQEKKEFLEKRKLYYGRDLTVNEFMALGQIKPCDQTFFHKTKALWKDNPALFNLMINSVKKYPGFGAFIASSIGSPGALLRSFVDFGRASRKRKHSERVKIVLPELKVHAAPMSDLGDWSSDSDADDASDLESYEFVEDEFEETFESDYESDYEGDELWD